jgi:hypothetical protein
VNLIEPIAYCGLQDVLSSLKHACLLLPQSMHSLTPYFQTITFPDRLNEQKRNLEEKCRETLSLACAQEYAFSYGLRCFYKWLSNVSKTPTSPRRCLGHAPFRVASIPAAMQPPRAILRESQSDLYEQGHPHGHELVQDSASSNSKALCNLA